MQEMVHTAPAGHWATEAAVPWDCGVAQERGAAGGLRGWSMARGAPTAGRVWVLGPLELPRQETVSPDHQGRQWHSICQFTMWLKLCVPFKHCEHNPHSMNTSTDRSLGHIEHVAVCMQCLVFPKSVRMWCFHFFIAFSFWLECTLRTSKLYQLARTLFLITQEDITLLGTEV